MRKTLPKQSKFINLVANLNKKSDPMIEESTEKLPISETPSNQETKDQSYLLEAKRKNSEDQNLNTIPSETKILNIGLNQKEVQANSKVTESQDEKKDIKIDGPIIFNPRIKDMLERSLFFKKIKSGRKLNELVKVYLYHFNFDSYKKDERSNEFSC